MNLAGRGHPDECLTVIRVSMSAQDTRRFTNINGHALETILLRTTSLTTSHLVP